MDFCPGLSEILNVEYQVTAEDGNLQTNYLDIHSNSFIRRRKIYEKRCRFFVCHNFVCKIAKLEIFPRS